MTRMKWNYTNFIRSFERLLRLIDFEKSHHFAEIGDFYRH